MQSRKAGGGEEDQSDSGCEAAIEIEHTFAQLNVVLQASSLWYGSVATHSDGHLFGVHTNTKYYTVTAAKLIHGIR